MPPSSKRSGAWFKPCRSQDRLAGRREKECKQHPYRFLFVAAGSNSAHVKRDGLNFRREWSHKIDAARLQDLRDTVESNFGLMISHGSEDGCAPFQLAWSLP
jgi:hypothetical protein